MGRPRTHDADTREALLGAGLALLIEEGAAFVTVRSVARRAGTTTRAVYSLFGSQDAFLDVLRARASDSLVGYLMRVPMTDDPVDDLVRLGAAGLRGFVVEEAVLYAFMMAGAGRGTAPGRFDPRILRLFESRARRVAEASGWSGPESEALAIQFLGAAAGMAVVEAAALLPPGQEAATWTSTLRALVRGLGGPHALPIGGFAPQHRVR